MNKETKILVLESRKALLEARDRENRNIVKKLDRKIRSLKG